MIHQQRFPISKPLFQPIRQLYPRTKSVSAIISTTQRLSNLGHTPKPTCWKRIFIIIQLFNRDKHCKRLQGKFGNYQSFNKFHVKLCGCNTFEGILRSTSTRTKQAGDVWCDVLGVDSFCLGGAAGDWVRVC